MTRYIAMGQNRRKMQVPGRSGGLSGAAGYHFQDLYTVLQLAKLLVGGDPDPPIEIMWEKKAVNLGKGPEPVHVDDVIILSKSGRRIYVQVKEDSSGPGWSGKELVRTRVLAQFWQEWSTKIPQDQNRTILRLASGGDVRRLKRIVDISHRVRNPSELFSPEASIEVAEDLKVIANALPIEPSDPLFLNFLKSIEAEQLRDASDLEGLINTNLGGEGTASKISELLLKLVTDSKHIGRQARSSYAREALIEKLQENGVTDGMLIEIGAVRARPPSEVWGKPYLEEVAKRRVVNLLDDSIYVDRTVVRYDPYQSERKERSEPLSLEVTLANEQKLVLLGPPGIGKTTSLLNLAQQTAIQSRARTGLTTSDVEIPIYVSLKYYNGEEELETLLSRSVNDVLRTRNLMLASDAKDSSKSLNEWMSQPAAKFLVLVDDLNEVRGEFYMRVHGMLQSFLHSTHRVIIACRERDYDLTLRDRATAFVLQGLQTDKILNYLKQIPAANGAQLFDQRIMNDEEMMTIAANPLLLSIMVFLARHNPDILLPSSRSQLLKQFVIQMPSLRRQEAIADRIPTDVVIGLLEQLGFELQERERLSIDLAELRTWKLSASEERLEDALIQAKEWRFLSADGRKREPVEFIHPLFLRYFAAAHLNNELQKAELQKGGSYDEILGDRPFHYQWEEVISLLLGISVRPTELIRWLSDQAVNKKKWRMAFLIRSFAENVDAANREEIRSATNNLYLAFMERKGMSLEMDAGRASRNTRDPQIIKDLMIKLRKGNDLDREVALIRLLEIGMPVVESLISALQGTNKKVSGYAALALGLIGSPKAVEPLIARLGDNNRTVRAYASEALAMIDQPAVIPLIIALSEKRAVVREWAAYALEGIDDPRAVTPLIKALQDNSSAVRERAARALGRMRDREAVEPLVALLRDRVTMVREEAASALGEIKDPRAVEPLISALRDRNESVRAAVASALGEAGDPRAIEPLFGSLRSFTYSGSYNVAIRALKNIGEAAVDPLIGKLTSPVARDRIAAATALGEIGNPLALPELTRMAREDTGEAYGDSAKNVAKAAVAKIRWEQQWNTK